jgi:hypothetical protein
MTQLRIAIFSAFLVSANLVSAPSSLACSPRKVSTPQELVSGADGIYHVRSSNEIPGPPSSSHMPRPQPNAQVTFRVLSVIKGARRTMFLIPADFVPEADPNDHPVPYNFVRPGGRRGNCYAVTFKQGQEYLLFLKGGTPYWSPLAPTTEQVAGTTDPWLIWVRRELAKQTERPNNSFKPSPHQGGD